MCHRAVRKCQPFDLDDSEVLAEQAQRIGRELGSDPLDGTKCQVALSPFDTADVRSMNAQKVRERLLGESLLKTIGAQTLAKPSLQLALHGWIG